MNNKKTITTLTDLTILVFVVLLNPLNPVVSYHSKQSTRIPDKIEILFRQQPTGDSIRLALQHLHDEMEEMRYYLRVHNVTDDGYNLVAQYNNQLHSQLARLSALSSKSATPSNIVISRRRIPAKDRSFVAVKTLGGYWYAGHFHTGTFSGKGIVRDYRGRIVSALFDCDTVVTAIRMDSIGIYCGQMDRWYIACGQGTMDEWDGCHKEGFWMDDRLHGFGFDSSPNHQLRIGEWKKGKFLGEKLRYTAERIYGIDISRHQHEKGRHRYGINWRQLRITSLGNRHDTEGLTYPVSFVYIKSTEGTTIRNRYFASDYAQAKRHGFHVGSYHFFSLRSSAQAQANYFVNHTLFRKGDFPPVLDVEPSDAQILQIGGTEELMRRIRTFMQIVESRTGMRPILYVNQMFINKHMVNAADIKKKYNVWIARYGQYKPDVKLVYWQLCPDGRVNGITGPVDINVFNGYQGQYEEFVRTGFHQ